MPSSQQISHKILRNNPVFPFPLAIGRVNVAIFQDYPMFACSEMAYVHVGDLVLLDTCYFVVDF